MAEHTDRTVVLFDIGGILLTNGWDRDDRSEACRVFGLDPEDFGDRHDFVVDGWERGTTDLDTYLHRTVFYRSRSFERDEFVAFMQGRSRAHPEALDLVRRLRAGGRHVLMALNNESRELNEHRIRAFGLNDLFHAFLSSCYLGVRKPDPEIYATAADIVHRSPAECVFVDDRLLNVESAREAGLTAVHCPGPGALARALAEAGVTP